MDFQITFVHLDRIESLETCVDDKITAVLEKFGEDLFSHVQVRLEKCNSAEHMNNGMFVCDLVANSRRYSTIHVRKNSYDLYAAIQEVGQKLNNVLSREHKNLISGRHQQNIPVSPL